MKYRSILKVSPLRLVMSHPGVEISFETFITKNFSMQLSAAHLHDIEVFVKSGTGSQVALEARLYDRNVNTTRPYIGFEAGYYELVNPGFYFEYLEMSNPPDTNYTMRNFSSFLYFIPKFGIQVNGNGRLILECFTGIGFKYVNESYDLIDKVKSTPDLPERKYDKYWDLKVALNFRVGWRF